MWDWAYANPNLAIGAVVTSIAAIYGVVHWGLGRHGEFVEFKGHMDREEKHVWPELKKDVKSLADVLDAFRQETKESIADFQKEDQDAREEFQNDIRKSQAEFRLEVVKMHFDHGERLAKVEVALRLTATETLAMSKQVNGQTTALNQQIAHLEREIEILTEALNESNRRAEMLAVAAAEALKKKV